MLIQLAFYKISPFSKLDAYLPFKYKNWILIACLTKSLEKGNIIVVEYNNAVVSLARQVVNMIIVEWAHGVKNGTLWDTGIEKLADIPTTLLHN